MREADEVQVAEPAATMPPLALLLGLETHVLMGVVDAMLGGATWLQEETRWRLYPRLHTRLTHVATILANGVLNDLGMPDPLGDGEAGDAAAYRMESRERIAVVPELDQWAAFTPTYGGYRRDGDILFLGAPVPAWHIREDRRTAACLAVCHKYADHPELGPLCRELITRLTSKENTE